MALQADDKAPDREKAVQAAAALTAEAISPELAELLGPRDLLRFMAHAESLHSQYMADIRPKWRRNLRAARNEHFEGSKYTTKAFAARSKFFRPKTRGSIRKNMATAATALFSTDDVLTVSAESDDTKEAAASAAVLNAVINYRLDRTSSRSGIPWFTVAMGANFDAQTTAMCCSRQSWQYEVVTLPGTEPIMGAGPELELSPEGMPQIDQATGALKMKQVEVGRRPRSYIAKDRPMIDLVPMENVVFDVTAPWNDIAQGGSYFAVRWPMSLGEFKQLMRQNGQKAQTRWLSVPDQVLIQATEDYDASGVRMARTGGSDPKQRSRQSMGGVDRDYMTIWPQENFVRVDGLDLHFWSIGTLAFASTVQPTIEVFPWLFGQRPYTLGVGAIEPHVAVPMSPVESWQQIQGEMNDLVNLRMDMNKQAVEPIVKLKAGSVFDVGQLRDRGAPGANVVVRNMEDMEFDRSPEAPAGAYADMQHLNADFDDLSGTFSGGSVQTNRSLNETVGGMRLLSGAANALTEFDLRVWVETWVETTLRQVLLMEQALESDHTVLRVAADRAELTRYGVDALTDEDLATECVLRVNVGIGAADPMQGMTRLGMALKMLAEAGPFLDRPVKVDAEEIIREVMGKAGYRDGMRFFALGEPGEGDKPSPDEVKAQATMAVTQANNESREKIAAEKNATSLELERMRLRMDMVESLLTKMVGTEDRERGFQEQRARDDRQIRSREGSERRRTAADLVKAGFSSMKGAKSGKRG